MKNNIIPIPERLKEIRTYHLYTQEYIASILGIERSTYAGWECYKRIIPLVHLNKLANFYNVSLDYMLGLTNNVIDTKKIDIDINIANSNFLLIRKENRLTQKELASKLNISDTTVRDYEKKRYLLSTHVCYDLARSFNISIDWLCGKSDNKFIE